MILTRSPYYINQVFANDKVTDVNWNIKINRSNQSGNGEEEIFEIDLKKNNPTAGITGGSFTNLWANISEIIRPYYQHEPFLLTALQSSTIVKARNHEVLNAIVEVTQNDSINSTIPVSNYDLACTDGYTRFIEGQNKIPLNKILLSNDVYEVAERGYFIVPLWVTNNAQVLTINSVAQPTLTLSNEPYDNLQYLIIRANEYTTDITVAFDGEEVYIERKPDCKYPVIQIQFLNRFGALESLDFRMSNKESLSIEKSMYKNAQTNGFSYSTTKAQRRVYNNNGSRKINVNTGFLNEAYNLTMEELMLSEKTWMVKGAETFPINLDSSSLRLKTGVVDKLIEYSLDFEYAYELLNNV